jgi:hypothetical protein
MNASDNLSACNNNKHISFLSYIYALLISVHRGKPLHLGLISGTSDVYPSVEGVLQSEDHPMLKIAVECLFDTGCLFSNFIKKDTARQLGSNILEEDERHRHVTLEDGSLTSS